MDAATSARLAQLHEDYLIAPITYEIENQFARNIEAFGLDGIAWLIDFGHRRSPLLRAGDNDSSIFKKIRRSFDPVNRTIAPGFRLSKSFTIVRARLGQDPKFEDRIYSLFWLHLSDQDIYAYCLSSAAFHKFITGLFWFEYESLVVDIAMEIREEQASLIEESHRNRINNAKDDAYELLKQEFQAKRKLWQWDKVSFDRVAPPGMQELNTFMKH